MAARCNGINGYSPGLIDPALFTGRRCMSRSDRLRAHARAPRGRSIGGKSPAGLKTPLSVRDVDRRTVSSIC